MLKGSDEWTHTRSHLPWSHSDLVIAERLIFTSSINWLITTLSHDYTLYVFFPFVYLNEA